MLRRLVVYSVSALVAASADAGERRPVVVTRDNPELHAGCRPGAVAERIWDFMVAFNHGDARAAARIMVPRAGPRDNRPRGWYSVTEGDPSRGGRHFVAYRRAPLVRYFARRHRHGERMRLLSVAVGEEGTRSGGMEYRVERTADDLRSIGVTNRVAHGKASIVCGSRKIFVWSMSQAPRRPLGGAICPEPPGGAQARTVACARRR
jgi:hypothetical protein